MRPPGMGKEEPTGRRSGRAAKSRSAAPPKAPKGRGNKAESSGGRRISTEHYKSQVLVEDFVDTLLLKLQYVSATFSQTVSAVSWCIFIYFLDIRFMSKKYVCEMSIQFSIQLSTRPAVVMFTMLGLPSSRLDGTRRPYMGSP